MKVEDLRGRTRRGHFFRTRRGFGRGRGQGVEARGNRFDQQLDDFPCSATVRILVGVVLRHIKTEQIFMFYKLDEGSADVLEAQSAAAGDVHRWKILLRDDVEVEVENEFARVRMHLRQRFVRRLAATLGLNVPGVNMPHRGFGEEVPLRRVESFESEKRYIWLAHQRRLAPEAHQFRRALADDVGHNHSVDAARGSGSRRIQISVAIEPEKIYVLVVSPGAG